MPSATPLYTVHAYKAETTYGTLPLATGAQMLRRVNCQLDVDKDTYESNEQRTDMQRADFRHGVRRVSGKLSGELSCGSYADWIAAAVKRDWTTITNITSLTLTIAVSGTGYTLTRSTGDFITGNVKVGMVGKLTGGTAGNQNKHFLVTNVTALVLTVQLFNGNTLTTESGVAGYTLALPGKSTYIPTSGHTAKSFTLEKWFADLVQSEAYTGLRPTTCSLKLPPSGLTTIDMDLLGQNMVATTAQYFSGAAAALTTGIMSSVNGAVRVASGLQASVTGLELNIKCPWSADPVVGSNVLPETVPDTVTVSGQMTINFDSVTLRDAFLAETEVEAVIALAADGTATTNVLSFCMSRVKLGGFKKSDDAGKYVTVTVPFEALLYGTSGTKYEVTTLWMQDTSL